MGSCVKTWLTFPPEEKNLDLMAKSRGREGKARSDRQRPRMWPDLAHRLHKGHESLCWHPPHRLYRTRWLSSRCQRSHPRLQQHLPKLMARGLEGFRAARSKEVVFDRFLLSVVLGFDNNRVEIVLEAWIEGLEFAR